MAEQQHPITPQPELVRKWIEDWAGGQMKGPVTEGQLVVATQAARWGADAELEAILKMVGQEDLPEENRYFDGLFDGLTVAAIRAVRRPKPPSLAEQALRELERTIVLLMPVTGSEKIKRLNTIRAALERLQELEKLHDDQG